MDKSKFIKNYIQTSQRRIKYCENALNDKDFAYVVRESQTIVELCFKALLYRYNFVFPDKPEVSSDLKEVLEIYSDNIKKNYKKFAKLSKELRRNRELALYGDPDADKVSNEFFTKDQAENYLKEVKELLEIVKEELVDFL
ncbi:MAG: HEPN domain-containing protein [Nanoarchaeota archaeon]